MSLLSLGFQALYMCSRSEERAWAGCRQGRRCAAYG